MKFNIYGKNMEVTDGLRRAVTEKLGKLERYFTSDTEVHVTMSVEKERQKIEVTIPVKGNIIRSEQVSNDMYVSIDLVEEVIERQLRKYKEKIIAKHQNGGNFKKEFIETKADVARFSSLASNSQMYASKYLTYMPTEEELSREIEQQKHFFLMQHGKE